MKYDNLEDELRAVVAEWRELASKFTAMGYAEDDLVSKSEAGAILVNADELETVLNKWDRKP